ncbi:MAG: polysaccharide biosynthesis C-terminal domain-containing protein [Alphaproteobacteria bacterium]
MQLIAAAGLLNAIGNVTEPVLGALNRTKVLPLFRISSLIVQGLMLSLLIWMGAYGAALSQLTTATLLLTVNVVLQKLFAQIDPRNYAVAVLKIALNCVIAIAVLFAVRYCFTTLAPLPAVASLLLSAAIAGLAYTLGWAFIERKLIREALKTAR